MTRRGFFGLTLGGLVAALMPWRAAAQPEVAVGSSAGKGYSYTFVNLQTGKVTEVSPEPRTYREWVDYGTFEAHGQDRTFKPLPLRLRRSVATRSNNLDVEG